MIVSKGINMGESKGLGSDKAKAYYTRDLNGTVECEELGAQRYRIRDYEIDFTQHCLVEAIPEKTSSTNE